MAFPLGSGQDDRHHCQGRFVGLAAAGRQLPSLRVAHPHRRERRDQGDQGLCVGITHSPGATGAPSLTGQGRHIRVATRGYVRRSASMRSLPQAQSPWRRREPARHREAFVISGTRTQGLERDTSKRLAVTLRARQRVVDFVTTTTPLTRFCPATRRPGTLACTARPSPLWTWGPLSSSRRSAGCGTAAARPGPSRSRRRPGDARCS